MSSTSTTQEKGFFARIEKWGNKIPHAAYLFLGMSVIVALCSVLFSMLGTSAVHPVSGEVVTVNNLLTASSIADFLKNMGNVWMSFAPMLTVPICTLGLGVANRSGLLPSMLKLAGSGKSKWIATLLIAFIGVNSNLIGDAAAIIFPPLVALLFAGLGRNPLAGLFLAFASRCVGYGANLLVGDGDATLAGLTQEAAQLIDPNFVANPTMGWYFLFVSTFFLTVVCACVNIFYIEPRLERTGLGKDSGLLFDISDDAKAPLTTVQRKGLRNALIALIIFALCAVTMTLPGLPFAAPEGGSILDGHLFKCIPALVLIMFFSTGYVYGKTTGSVKNFGSTLPMMRAELGTMTGFFFISFFSSQFISLFKGSNLATIIAIKGGELLESLSVPSLVLMILFVVLVALINLFMASSSGKWGLLASIFVPMFMVAGINPAFVQVAYRMGDGLTNNICPTSSPVAVLLSYVSKYDKRAGFGTFVSYMLPYTLFAGVAWLILLVIWVLLGLPMGPGYAAHI